MMQSTYPGETKEIEGFTGQAGKADLTGCTEFWAEPHHLWVLEKLKGVGGRYWIDKLPKYDKNTDINK